MELNEFVKESLVQICTGVKTANQALKSIDPEVKKRVFILKEGIDKESSAIEFDVAVTLKSDSKTGGEGTLKLAVAEVDLGKTKETSHETVSRIKFKVGLDWNVT